MSKCLADFTGCVWKIERVITDHRQSKKLLYKGRCEISFDQYFETGKTILADGQNFLSSRTYLWKSAGQAIDSYFDDGLFFHRIDLTCVMPTARHCCGEDQYDIGYDFSNWPLWDAKCCVKGPRKDYEMHSYYSKVSI